MKLMSVEAFRRKHFDPESAPMTNTIRRWLASGMLPGLQIGGLWYVDEERWLAGGDELVARVLQA